MLRRNKIRKLLVDNWKPKLVCLVGAVVVWWLVNHLLVRGESPEWDIDDIRLANPE